MSQEQAIVTRAREVWPEAEAFERAPGGWTFRVGGGYAYITDTGTVSQSPEGLRSHAQRLLEAQ